MSTFKEGDRIYVTKRNQWQGREGTVINNVSEDDEELVRARMDYDDEVRSWFPIDVEVFDPAPRKAKTKAEMEAIAKKMFGESASVYYSDYQWVIQTGVEEYFEEEKYKDREAYELYMNNSGGENQLERWGRKNGHGSESLAELFDSYDEEQERTSRRIVADVRRKVAEGWAFDWEGGPEWRDEVLKYAEEKGW